MRREELAGEVRAWARELATLDGPRWERFGVCARELARAIGAVASWPLRCGGCACPARSPVYAAALVYGDPAWLGRQLATVDGRAHVWGRLWLVAALLDGFCSESCANGHRGGGPRETTERDSLARAGRTSIEAVAIRRRRRRRARARSS